MPSYTAALALSLATAATVFSTADAAACGKSFNLKVMKPGFRLGAVVNYPKNEVLDGSFWTEQRIAENFETVDVDSVKTKISSVTSLKDKSDILDIDGSLTIDLISAGVSGTGKGAFLTTSDSSATTAEVMYSTTRKTKSDFIKEELMSELMAFNRFFAVPEATHVVTRVTYGGSILVSFSEESDSIEARDLLAASLEISIEKLGLKGSASITLDEEVKDEFKDVSLKVLSDLPLTKTPLTLQDVYDALADVPAAFERANEGRGIPLEVTLTPICVWSSDRIGQKVRQVTEDAVAEITAVMDAIFSGVASAKAVGRKAQNAGMPVLKVQAEDFANTLDRFASSVRVRLAQLLPSIRNSLASQIEAIAFTSKMRDSPFNYLALRRWMETANEDILEQNRLRRNLMDEARFPVGHKKDGWIKRRVVMINNFPQLQRLLVNPDVETAMVLVTVNRNSGLQSHLNVMLDYMSNPPLTREEINQFPSSFDKAKWLEAPDNAARTRGMTVNMARWAAQNECVLSGCKDVDQGEVLAMMDYNSFIEEFLSMGIKLDRTTVLLYRNGRLVNTDFQVCQSPNDPRDDEGRCLWRGDGDIPNGFSCALERPQGGCEGICGLDGRCRSFECGAMPEVKPANNSEPVHDWHKIRMHPDAVFRGSVDQEELGLFEIEKLDSEDEYTWVANSKKYTDKCLSFTPDNSRGLQIEDCEPMVATQRWRWGSKLMKQHVINERETSLCFEAVLYNVEPNPTPTVSTGPGKKNTGDATASPTKTKAPSLAPTTSAPSLAPTTTAHFAGLAAAEIYGHVEVRQCSVYNPMQHFQRYTVDFDTPHLMLRPPVVQPFDYQDLCAQFYRDPTTGKTGFLLLVCGNVLAQAVYETSPWRYMPGYPVLPEHALKSPWYATVVPASSASSDARTTIQFKEQFLDTAAVNHFFWEGSYLRPWFAKETNKVIGLNAGPTKGKYMSVVDAKLVVDYDGEDDKVPSPFFKVGAQIHSVSDGVPVAVGVGFWHYGGGLSTDTLVDRSGGYLLMEIGAIEAGDDETTAPMNRNILLCPELCEPLTCADQGKKNAECFTAGTKPICRCRAGWGPDTEDSNCDEQVDACIDNPCAADEFCTDLLPPAGNSANDRKCQLRTLCKVNEYLARPASNVTDNACSPCPAGTVQPEFNLTSPVGVGACETLQVKVDAIFHQLELDVPAVPAETSDKDRLLLTEDALRAACERRNSFYFPSENGKPPRCTDPCPEDKVSDCSDLGCSCIYRVQPAPVISSTEFGLILGGSAALGLVGAVGVVVVVDAVLRKVGRA